MRFILSDMSDFRIIDKLLIVVHALACRILMLLSVNEMLLPRYVNLSNSFREPPLNLLFDLNVCTSFWVHLHSHGGQCRPLPAPDYAADIRLG